MRRSGGGSSRGILGRRRDRIIIPPLILVEVLPVTTFLVVASYIPIHLVSDTIARTLLYQCKKSSEVLWWYFRNEDVLGPLISLILIFSTRDFCAVVVWTEALLWRYLVVVDREFIRDVFCANNWPCWLRSVKMEGCSGGRVVNGKSGGGYIKFVC